jgi:hypothetical protein
MTNDDAKIIEEITADHATMKQVRQSYEAQWNDIVDLVLPRHGGFGRTQDEMNKGRERSQKIFDATTALALRNFTAAMDSMITPHTQVWHRLSVSDESLGELDSVKAYLEAVVKILFAVRYRWKAGFAPNIGSAYKSMGAFGQGGMMIEHVVGRGIRYRNIPLSRMYFAENEGGAIDKTHVCWTLTARQAARRFGRNALSPSMQMILESDPEKTFEFRHVVKPREDYDTRKLDSLNMPFASYWLDEGGQTIIQRSGFRTFPFAIGRFDLSSDETYAGSPAMDSLPDVRMVNDMAKTNIKGAQKMVDPPLLISEDGALEGFDLRSGSLNWGGLDGQGREMAKPMQMGQQAQIGIEFAKETRESINQSFYVTLFQILVDSGDMTATEVMQRAQEKGILLAPTMGRVQNDMLGSLIEREIDICAEAGQFPPMPPEMIEAGATVDIQYDSPLNRAMRAGEGTAILQWLQQVGAVAQFDQRAMRVVNGEEIVRLLADIGSVPTKALLTRDAMSAQDDQMAQQQQMQQILAAAPVAAGAAKDLSEANLNSQNARV